MSDSEAEAVAGMGANPYDREGRFLHSDDHRLLCGQRAKFAQCRELPPFALWILPTAVGTSILLNALLRHPLARSG